MVLNSKSYGFTQCPTMSRLEQGVSITGKSERSRGTRALPYVYHGVPSVGVIQGMVTNGSIEPWIDDSPIDSVRQYLNESSQFPLLDSAAEYTLGTVIHAGKVAEVLQVLARGVNSAIEAKHISYGIAKDIFTEYGLDDGIKIILGEDKDIFDLSEESDPEIRAKLLKLDSIFSEWKQSAEIAKGILTISNLRLVVSIAKKIQSVEMLDFIQEGNIGLIVAVGKYDPTKGNKFSTYAEHVIKQQIYRAIADMSRTIRIPIHVNEELGTLWRAEDKLLKDLGRDPTPEEIAKEMKIGVGAVRRLIKARSLIVVFSTNATAGSEGSIDYAEALVDSSDGPEIPVIDGIIRDELLEVMRESLDPREIQVLMLRFGLHKMPSMTLEETGKIIGVTRERIRQIEAEALKKLAKPGSDGNNKLREWL